MDQGTYHGLLTLAALIGFIAIARWAWSSERKQMFDDAARAPLKDDHDGTGDPR